MQWFRSSLYIFASFILGGGISLYIFWGKDYPFTQNSLYHIQIAKSYIDQIWNLADLGILSHSYFKDSFIDQHFLFHLYLAPFLFLASPFLASKIAMSGLVAITTVFMQRVLRPSLGEFKALVISLFFLFFDSAPLKRIFWERPAIINFIAILVLILLYRRKAPYWVWLVMGYLFSMMSFGTACLLAIFGCLLLLEKNKKSLLTLFSLGVGVLGSFLITPFPDKKFLYFVELLFYNLFKEHSVGEWQEAPTSFGFIGPFVVLFGLSCAWLLYRQVARNSQKDLMLRIALGAAILLPASWYISRLAYLFVFASFILFAMVLGDFAVRFPRFGRAIVAGLLIALLPFSLLQMQEMKTSFRGDGRTARDVGDFPAWFRQSEFKNEPVLLMSWIYWSPLFFHDSRTRAEPGFSMFLYDHPANEVSRQLMRFWKNPESLTSSELKFLFDAFNSRLLLVEKKHEAYKVISEKMGYFLPVFENKTFVLFKLIPPAASSYTQEDEICRASQAQSFPYKDISFLTSSGIEQAHPWRAASLRTNKSILLLLPEPHPFPSEAALYPHLTGQFVYRLNDRFHQNLPPSVGNHPPKVFRVLQCNQTESGIVSSPRSLNPEEDLNKIARERLRTLLELYLRDRTSEDSPFSYYLGASRGPKDDDKRTARKHLALWSLCDSKKHFLVTSSDENYSKLCHRGLQVSLRNMAIKENPTFGEWVTLANALLEVDDNSAFDNDRLRAHQKILQYYENTEFDLSGSDLIPFGQGLMYLLSTSLPHDLPTQDYLDRYWHAYEENEKVFFVRWLAGSLTLAYKKWKSPIHLEHLRQLYQNTVRRYMQNSPQAAFAGCPIGELSDNATIQTPHHIAALLAEGFAQALATEDIGEKAQIDPKPIQGLLQCALRLQISPYNSKILGVSEQVMGAVPYAYLNSILRIDVQAHTTQALGYYLEWLKVRQ